MGYAFVIGELEVTKHPDDGIDCRCIHFGAKGYRFDSAPAYGEPTDYTSERWPSYTAWSNFMRGVDLHHVFFSNGHLIGGHPGVRLITKELVDTVKNALEEFKNQNPNLVAEMSTDDEKDGWLCRLIWLDFWLTWAFENCETPVIANT